MWTVRCIIFKTHSGVPQFYSIWSDIQAYMRFVWLCDDILLENKFYSMFFAAVSALEKSEEIDLSVLL